MAQTSSDLQRQIDALLGQINPALDRLPEAEKFYKDKTNEAYNYNLGNLQNAAQLEGKMYSMPGELMSQYDTEFGGKTGINSNQRINSILSQLGNQSAVSNTAWGLADQAGTRINDLATTLLNQYKSGIEAKQMKLSPLMSMWDRMYAEEQANKRAANTGTGGYSGIDWNKLMELLGDKGGNTTTTTTTNKSLPGTVIDKVNSLKGGTFANDYLISNNNKPKPVNTASVDFNRIVNNMRGL